MSKRKRLNLQNLDPEVSIYSYVMTLNLLAQEEDQEKDVRVDVISVDDILKMTE